jgi:hypothetical protein
VIVQDRLGRSYRRSAAWRLAGGLSPRRANFLHSTVVVRSTGAPSERPCGGLGGAAAPRGSASRSYRRRGRLPGMVRQCPGAVRPAPTGGMAGSQGRRCLLLTGGVTGYQGRRDYLQREVRSAPRGGRSPLTGGAIDSQGWCRHSSLLSSRSGARWSSSGLPPPHGSPSATAIPAESAGATWPGVR